jgi:hypothetical protein
MLSLHPAASNQQQEQYAVLRMSVATDLPQLGGGPGMHCQAAAAWLEHAVQLDVRVLLQASCRPSLPGATLGVPILLLARACSSHPDAALYMGLTATVHRKVVANMCRRHHLWYQ